MVFQKLHFSYVILEISFKVNLLLVIFKMIFFSIILLDSSVYVSPMNSFSLTLLSILNSTYLTMHCLSNQSRWTKIVNPYFTLQKILLAQPIIHYQKNWRTHQLPLIAQQGYSKSSILIQHPKCSALYPFPIFQMLKITSANHLSRFRTRYLLLLILYNCNFFSKLKIKLCWLL